MLSNHQIKVIEDYSFLKFLSEKIKNKFHYEKLFYLNLDLQLKKQNIDYQIIEYQVSNKNYFENHISNAMQNSKKKRKEKGIKS